MPSNAEVDQLGALKHGVMGDDYREKKATMKKGDYVPELFFIG